MTWKIYTRRGDWDTTRHLLIQKGDGLYVAPLTIVEVPDHLIPMDTLSTMRRSDDDVEGFLRASLNCAWELGMRPDGFLDTTESMAATRKHLEDMRALAAAAHGVVLP
jgi:hypothetical protein